MNAVTSPVATPGVRRVSSAQHVVDTLLNPRHYHHDVHCPTCRRTVMRLLAEQNHDEVLCSCTKCGIDFSALVIDGELKVITRETNRRALPPRQAVDRAQILALPPVQAATR